MLNVEVLLVFSFYARVIYVLAMDFIHEVERARGSSRLVAERIEFVLATSLSLYRAAFNASKSATKVIAAPSMR
jgi:hypothetical protein